MIINNHISNIKQFKESIYKNAKTYVSHSNRNGVTDDDMKLCLYNELLNNNFNIDKNSVFKIQNCIIINFNYIEYINYDSYNKIDNEYGNSDISDSENTFFDAFSNNNCSCKICTNLNKNIDKIKNVKLNYLMYTINL